MATDPVSRTEHARRERPAPSIPRPIGGRRLGRGVLFATSLALALGGCASGARAPDGAQPSGATLQRAAREAMTASGNVHVRFADGVAVVTGNLESATDERAIERSLLGLEGVERVELHVRRAM